EEAGLLGASAFTERSPAMQEVGALVNLEARGSSGPSLMFETSGPDAWAVSRFAARVSRPFTSSLFPTVYQFLPNDTDLTVFKGRGELSGLNFAFIGEPSRYHTPADNFANASPASLQHHGDNALAAVRGPAGLSPLLGVLALALTLAAAVLARRRGILTWSSFGLGLLVTPAALLLTLAVAFGLQATLAGAFPSPWVARPLAAIAAFWLVSLAVTLWTAVLLTRRGGVAGFWSGVW